MTTTRLPYRSENAITALAAFVVHSPLGANVSRLGMFLAWPLLVAEPPGSRPSTFDPGAVWTLMAGGDVMLDRTVYKRAILEGRYAPKDVVPVDFEGGKFVFERTVH